MSKRQFQVILVLAIVWSAGPIFAADLGKGNILFEWFDGARSATSMAQITDGRLWRYPDNPTVSQWRTSFDGVDGRGDYYVTRVRGYVHPPANGDYTFWITSDDQSQLWLSTNEDPANRVMISQVTGNSGATEWTKYPEQKSALVSLKAGKKYYIEALHREGSGGDRLRVAWGGPTIGAGPTIIAGTYLSPWIRPIDLMASNPSPVNGELGAILPLLTWSKGVTTVRHNLYFGTEPNAPFIMQFPAALATTTYYHPITLEAGVTYYWWVDEVELDGTTIHKGDTWTFRAPPLNAWGPTPADGAQGALTDVALTWHAGKDAYQHELYFGENEADVVAGTGDTLKGKTPLATFSPGALKADTTYYWRVDEIDTADNKVPGVVWKFRTLPQTIADPNLIGWWKFDESMGTAVDYSGHGYHGTINGGTNGGVQPAAGMAGGALEFDGMDDYIDIGKNAVDLGIDGAKPKSVSVWVYTHSFHDGGIFETGARVASQNFSLRARTSNNQWRVQYYSVDQDFTYTSLNTWVHFVLVYDGTTSTCYANGTVVASAARTLNTVATLTFQVGVYSSYRFDGLIDDLRLYNKALTAEEVKYLFERTDPRQAWSPTPTVAKVTDAVKAVPLTWKAGDGAVHHDVYLTTDPNAARDANMTDTTGAYRGRIDANSYTPDPILDWNDTYYWRVDEVMSNGDVAKGRLWNFRITNWLIIDDFESYTDYSPNRIFQTWLDGLGYSADEFFPKAYNGNNTGAGVGHDIISVDSPYYNGSFAERGLRHSGAQSMPLYYANSNTPYYSETERSWTEPQDWTIQNVNAVVLRVHGNPRKFVQTSDSSFSLSAAGTDIWNAADQFRYAYKTLNGDGTIIARVDSNGVGTNRWAKGGVMIRANNTPGSVNAMVAATGGDGGGFTFQWRVTPDTAYPASSNTPNPRVAPPLWIKLIRTGNDFTGFFSLDGVTWTQQGTVQTVVMTDPVMIGVAVTSHAANQLREFEFSNITTTGKVTGAWTVEDIGIAQRSNEDPMPLYVVVQDSGNRSAVVVHPDANILLSEGWSDWKIPLTDFTGVNMKAVKKMFIGVGDRKKPQAGGDGLIYIDNIGLIRPAPVTPSPRETPVH